MRKIASLFLAITLSCQVALADCNWDKDVSKIDVAHYSYSVGCHMKVGETVRDLKVAQNTMVELDKIISLKNEEITYADKRAAELKQTVLKLDDKLSTVQNLERGNRWLYVGIGMIVSGAAIYGVSQIKH